MFLGLTKAFYLGIINYSSLFHCKTLFITHLGGTKPTCSSFLPSILGNYLSANVLHERTESSDLHGVFSLEGRQPFTELKLSSATLIESKEQHQEEEQEGDEEKVQ